MAKAQFTKQMTIKEFEEAFPNDDACKAYLQSRRWPVGVYCARCGNEKLSTLVARPFHWQCRNCSDTGYRFSVLVGTIFENTNIPMRDWFRVIHMMLTSKKGIAALEVQRVMGFGSYKTAHYLCMRIRAGLVDPEFRQLMGIVEGDEIFVGGSQSNKHRSKRTVKGGTEGKLIVAGAIERKGNVVARVIQGRTSSHDLHSFLNAALSDKVSLLCTDQWRGYRGINKKFPHGTVDHSIGQYVVGAMHTQTIEGFWSLIKRGIMGTYHKVSAKYPPLYVAEYAFSYNNRHTGDIFGAAVARC